MLSDILKLDSVPTERQGSLEKAHDLITSLKASGPLSDPYLPPGQALAPASLAYPSKTTFFLPGPD
jgi:hypothetical protein